MTHLQTSSIIALRERLFGSARYRKLWLGVVVLRALVLAPSALAEEPASDAAKHQKLTLDEVRIEGKLYSPQALFIVTRAPEPFGRDAVVPHVLRHDPNARLFPFRMDDALLAARREAVRGASPLPLTTTTPPRRSR